MFNPENRVILFLNKIVDLSFVGLLWFALSITVIGFGPATVAAYYAVVKTIRRERSGPVKEFFGAVKSNFKRGALLGVLLVGMVVSLYFTDFVANRSFFLGDGSGDKFALAFMLIKVVLLIGVCLYAFPIMSRFDMKLVRIFVASVLLLFRHFLSTVAMIAVVAVAITIVAILPPMILVVPGITFYIISYPMERIMKQHMQAQDKEQDSDKDQWYLEP